MESPLSHTAVEGFRYSALSRTAIEGLLFREQNPKTPSIAGRLETKN
jgi:hypothetical protein